MQGRSSENKGELRGGRLWKAKYQSPSKGQTPPLLKRQVGAKSAQEVIGEKPVDSEKEKIRVRERSGSDR